MLAKDAAKIGTAGYTAMLCIQVGLLGRTIVLCIKFGWSVHASVGDYNGNVANDFDDDVNVAGDGEGRGKP